MEEKRNTKKRIADSLKALLSKMPMEKITVQEIAEQAGVIRPTFYNHFKDKYEVLEYIIRHDMLMPIKPLLINDLMREGLTLLFSNIKNERDFYDNAVRIEGQNSFESIAVQEVTKLLVEIMEEKFKGTMHFKYAWLSRDAVAGYYAQSMIYVVLEWIKRDYIITPHELSEIYEFLTKSSMVDVMKEI